MADILERIRHYLSSGGLFNPELMPPEATRDLVLDAREEIEKCGCRPGPGSSMFTCADHSEIP